MRLRGALVRALPVRQVEAHSAQSRLLAEDFPSTGPRRSESAAVLDDVLDVHTGCRASQT